MPATIASPPLTARPLRCRSCGAERAAAPIAICENCLGPLDPVYEPGRALPDRATIAGRGPSLWRYKEWLPFDGDPVWSLDTRFTPLLEASALARRFGVARVWVKNDTVSHPSLSFKDRVVAAAINAAAAFGLDTIGCASTGNLANAVAAHAARAGLKAWIFVPETLETPKVIGTAIYGPRLVRVRGTYDDVNRLCAQVDGCAPIVRLVERGGTQLEPEVPNTICRSLAIGSPADGVFAARAVRESGGWAAAVSDTALVDGIRFLAQDTGVFAETAGGVTAAAALALARAGRLGPADEVVLCITGHGLKTLDAVSGALPPAPPIGPRVKQVAALVEGDHS